MNLSKTKKTETEVKLVDYRPVLDDKGDMIGGCALLYNIETLELVWRIRGMFLKQKAERLPFKTFQNIEDCKTFAKDLLT